MKKTVKITIVAGVLLLGFGMFGNVVMPRINPPYGLSNLK